MEWNVMNAIYRRFNHLGCDEVYTNAHRKSAVHRTSHITSHITSTNIHHSQFGAIKVRLFRFPYISNLTARFYSHMFIFSSLSVLTEKRGTKWYDRATHVHVHVLQHINISGTQMWDKWTRTRWNIIVYHWIN